LVRAGTKRLRSFFWTVDRASQGVLTHNRGSYNRNSKAPYSSPRGGRKRSVPSGIQKTARKKGAEKEMPGDPFLQGRGGRTEGNTKKIAHRELKTVPLREKEKGCGGGNSIAGGQGDRYPYNLLQRG